MLHLNGNPLHYVEKSFFKGNPLHSLWPLLLKLQNNCIFIRPLNKRNIKWKTTNKIIQTHSWPFRYYSLLLNLEGWGLKVFFKWMVRIFHFCEKYFRNQSKNWVWWWLILHGYHNIIVLHLIRIRRCLNSYLYAGIRFSKSRWKR